MGLHQSASAAVLCVLFFSTYMRAEAQQSQGAQQPPAPAAREVATITVNAQLVDLQVVVGDKKGALVQNLHEVGVRAQRGWPSGDHPVFRQGQRSTDT